MRVALDVVSDSRATILVGESEIGRIEFAVEHGRMDVGWIEVEASRRRWGLGMDTVRALEVEAVRRWSVRSARAEVPLGVGLALYFWLRLGYRPEEPVRSDGDAFVMVRGLVK
jgi:hypothetical protein